MYEIVSSILRKNNFPHKIKKNALHMYRVVDDTKSRILSLIYSESYSSWANTFLYNATVHLRALRQKKENHFSSKCPLK